MGLFFANPLLLWGLLAGAIPLLIHLFRRRQARRHSLPTLRFLTEVHRRRLVHVRLQDLLLLILRSLVVILIVMALAGPKVVLSGGGGIFGSLGAAGTASVLLIDTSRSMSYREGVESRLDQAKEAARQLIEQTPLSTHLAIIPFSDGTEEELRALPATLTPERTRWTRRLEEAEVTDRRGRISWGLRQAAELLADYPAGSIYLFTDLQKTGWEDLLAAQSPGQDLPVPISVVDCSSGRSENVWFERVHLSRLPLGAGETTKLDTWIAASPTVDSMPVQVQIVSASPEDNPMAERVLAQRELFTQPGRALSTSMPFVVPASDTLLARLTLSIEGFSDPLQMDNEVDLQREVLQSIRIGLLLPTEVPGGRTDTEFVGSSVRLALETPGSEDAEPFIQVELLDFQNPDVFDPEELDSVFVYRAGALPSLWQNRLNQYVREGGSVLAFLDLPPDGEEATKEPDRESWLRGLGFEISPAMPSDENFRLRLEDGNHPALESFSAGGEGLFSTVRLYLAFSVNHPEARTLASCSVQSATAPGETVEVVTELALGSGKIVVCGIPLDRQLSNLTTSALWVPLLQQMAKYLAAGPQQIYPSEVLGLFPEESDLTPLSAYERNLLKERMRIDFSPAAKLDQATRFGQSSRDLTRAFLFFALGLSLLELVISNRMR